jgi:hypothetical protein
MTPVSFLDRHLRIKVSEANTSAVGSADSRERFARVTDLDKAAP